MNEYLEATAMKYAQSTGHLQGVLNGMALHDDNISPSRFKMIYDALVRSYELTGSTMPDSDVGRFTKRAKELGATL